MLRSVLIAAGLILGVDQCADAAAPLELETKIPLGEVAGRIDHLAIDAAQRRLFVAELGNNSIDVVDLNTLKRVKRLTGLKHPQGLGYVTSRRTLFVSSAVDGTLQALGEHGALPAKVHLGDDADNIRVVGDRIYVGYGAGAIASINAVSLTRSTDVELPAHPEGFEVAAASERLFVNLPEAHSVAIVDLATGKVIKQISTRGRGANFPLATATKNILVAFRNPPLLVAYAMSDGVEQAAASVCNDADDIFVDAKRDRAYVSCGEGYLDVFAIYATKLDRVAHLRTAIGARTSLFAPELDRLFVATPAAAGQSAAVWVYKPAD